MICPTHYYQLINRQRQAALVFKKSKDPTKQGAFMEEPNQQDIQQLWMLLEKNMDQKIYYLLHCQTDLKLTTHKEDIVNLENKDKSGQIYQIDTVPQVQMQHFWIKEQARPHFMLTLTQNGLRMAEEDPSRFCTQWQIRRVTKNQAINQSCIISCAHSGLVLTPHHSQKQGKVLRQALWNGFLNQRWIIEADKEFYRLRNFQTKREVTISQKALQRRIGTQITESVTNKSGHNQWWSLEQVGFQLYSIRTAFAEDLYLGVKGVKEDAQAELVSGSAATVWKIVGHV